MHRPRGPKASALSAWCNQPQSSRNKRFCAPQAKRPDSAQPVQRASFVAVSQRAPQSLSQLSNTDMSDAERIRELAAALGQLLDHVEQMRGLFPDDDALTRAIDDAEKALELAR